VSYEVRIRHTADTGDGITVEALVNGEAVSHTFPKGMGYFDESGPGKPEFVLKLEEKYEEKMKRRGELAASELSAEEQKVHASRFENQRFGGDESFKRSEDVKDSMSDVDLSRPDEIRDYLKENMAEGYLSDEEGMNIDEFVDEYERLLTFSEDVEQILEEAYSNSTQ